MRHIDLIQLDIKELQDMVKLHPMLEPHRYQVLSGNKEKLANIILAQQKAMEDAASRGLAEIVEDKE